MPNDARPPKKWWDRMYKEVSDGNPDYSDERVRKTVGDIWYNQMSEAERGQKRSYLTLVADNLLAAKKL